MDTSVRVWDARTGVLVAGPFTGHTQSILAVKFSPDGTHIVSGSTDRTVRVWKVDPIKQISTSAPKNSPCDNSRELFLFDRNSGWIQNREGAFLLWIPPWLREGLYLPHNTLVISATGTTKLDLSRFVHGTEWTKCFDPKFTNAQ
ncbi:hypothetical protein DFH06DRAFT_1246578 [Mycena polygramma]|nr:hypothetical protein DFH06DRAFT_1246578 [Mycena polygramma]